MGSESNIFEKLRPPPWVFKCTNLNFRHFCCFSISDAVPKYSRFKIMMPSLILIIKILLPVRNLTKNQNSEIHHYFLLCYYPSNTTFAAFSKAESERDYFQTYERKLFWSFYNTVLSSIWCVKTFVCNILIQWYKIGTTLLKLIQFAASVRKLCIVFLTL